MKIYTQKEILKALDIPYIIEELEKGLIAHAKQQLHASNVAFMRLESSRGEVHIKPGGIVGEDMYVVKVASGFYDNPKIGLATCQGLMLLFSQKTGQLEAILLDDGLLTDIRTALVGAICAKHLSAPIKRIGIIGTGTQAKLQLHYLQYVTECRNALVWGRDREKAAAFTQDAQLEPFSIQVADHLDQLAENCNLIITTTSSREPLLFGHQIRPGTHITAMGADEASKQELDASIFSRANQVFADSLSQCLKFGDLSHATHVISSEKVTELGAFLEGPYPRPPEWITVADLTGLGVEDLQIAKAVVQLHLQ